VGPAPVSFDLSLETEHFVFRFGQASADLMDDHAAALEAAYPRVTAELGQSGLPRITVRFYPDLESFRAATGWDAWGLIQGPNAFLMVASPFRPVIVVHEFAHCVSLHLNGTIDNNPTWLWEAVAVYEARDFIHPQSITCLANRQFPSLSQLNQRGGPCDIYRVGYTLSEYIVDGWGLPGLRDLIVANGDVAGVLGLSVAEFVAGWQRFVEERYL
jgi:hypothetical protein